MVNSVSATERIKLWNQFNANMDQDTVKNEFFRKVHRRNPPFRVRQKPKIRDRVEVPPVVEFHYQNPPNLLPSLRELLRAKKYDRFADTAKPIYDDSQLLSMIDSELKAISTADEQIEKMINVTGGTDPEEHEQAAEEGAPTKAKSSPRGKKHKSSAKKDVTSKAGKADEAGASNVGKAEADKMEGESPSKKPKVEVTDESKEENLQLQKSK